jgi:hypothetical protein
MTRALTSVVDAALSAAQAQLPLASSLPPGFSPILAGTRSTPPAPRPR